MITQEQEEKMGKAWKKLCKEEGHKPRHLEEPQLVSEQMRAKIYSFIERKGPIGQTEIREHFKASTRTITAALAVFMKRGTILRSNGRPYKYWVKPKLMDAKSYGEFKEREKPDCGDNEAGSIEFYKTLSSEKQVAT